MPEPEAIPAGSKFVACALSECPLHDVVFEIPWTMLVSIDEEVLCGTCGRITVEVAATRRSLAINHEQAAMIHAQNRPGWFGAAGPAAFPLLGGAFEANEATRKQAQEK